MKPHLIPAHLVLQSCDKAKEIAEQATTAAREQIGAKTGGVDGHPCAAFSVTGDYSRNQFPDFEGVFTDEEVTIESGKLWLSLIHP